MGVEWVEVTIRNWDKYNLRKDVKNCKWFRLDHNIFEEEDFFDFTAAEFNVWIYLLCQASKKSSSRVMINLSIAIATGRFKKKEFNQALKKLELNQCVLVHVPDTLRKRSATLHNSNNTKDSLAQKAARVCLDFSQAYQNYPRKMGKSEGIKRLNRDIKTEPDAQLFLEAVNRFKAHHEKEGTQKKFIPYFSTFVSHWRDWLDPDIGKTQQELKPVQSVEEILEEDRKRKLKIEEDLRGVGKL